MFPMALAGINKEGSHCLVHLCSKFVSTSQAASPVIQACASCHGSLGPPLCRELILTVKGKDGANGVAWKMVASKVPWKNLFSFIYLESGLNLVVLSERQRK